MEYGAAAAAAVAVAAAAAATSFGAEVLAAACEDEGKWLEVKHLHRIYANFSPVQALIENLCTLRKECITICWLSLLLPLQLFYLIACLIRYYGDKK